MHARKTGALIRGSAVAGAIMAGATAAERTAIDEYGAALVAARLGGQLPAIIGWVVARTS
jgi:hypothetical protein